jgi:hypothetical protein
VNAPRVSAKCASLGECELRLRPAKRSLFHGQRSLARVSCVRARTPPRFLVDASTDAVNRAATIARRAGAWLRSRIPELAFVLLGVGLRLSMRFWYDVSLGYDFPTHHQYVRYIVDHHSLPPYNLNVAAYHPPLFYLLAALMEGSGLSPQATTAISAVSASVQLLLMWLGLELYLRESRFARVLAIAVAAILPAAVHVAGMASNEALSDVFCTGALVLLPQVVARRGRAAVGYAAAAGACLGFALLTKISGAVVLVAYLMVLAIIVARLAPGARIAEVRARVPAVATVFALVAAIAGWHYTRHKILYGKFVMTGYDQWADPDPSHVVPLLDERPLGYVVYWNEAIFGDPYYPTASTPRARFWPLAVATTFSDYYSFGFVPRSPWGVPTVIKNAKPVRISAMPLSRASMVGGTFLAAATVIAWLIAARVLWRRRDDVRLMPLLVGLLAIVGQLHFATRYPYDTMGPVKGVYLQFAGPVYCAMTGLAGGLLWGRRRPLPRLTALGLVGATALVAAYTIFARVVIPITG